jgi:hypothetical protein
VSHTSKSAIAAMEGQGFYNRNSSLQAAGIEQVLPLWREAARSIAIGAETPTIVDYGSSQGRNSMSPMRVAIVKSIIPTFPQMILLHCSRRWLRILKATSSAPMAFTQRRLVKEDLLWIASRTCGNYARSRSILAVL